MREIVNEVSDNAFITNPGNDLAIFVEDEDEEGDGKIEYDDEGMPIVKSKKDKYAGKLGQSSGANMDTQNLFTADPSKYHHLLTLVD